MAAMPMKKMQAAQRTARTAQGVKPNPKAFAAALATIRAVYNDQVAALLEELRPQIEAGRFARLDDDGSSVNRGAPELDLLAEGALIVGESTAGWLEVNAGVYILEQVIGKLPIMQNGDFVDATFLVSPHFVEPDANMVSVAAECLAHDVRDLFFAQGGTIHATNSKNWRFH